MGARADLWISVLMALLGFALYWHTLAPTVLWGDPAKLAIFSALGNVKPYAGHHALRVLLGMVMGLLPFKDFAYGQNLMSATFAALTLPVVYGCARLLTTSRLAAVSAAVALGVSHVFWWLAVVSESYSLLVFLFALSFYFLLHWSRDRAKGDLILAFFIFGLSLSNHYFPAIFFPIFLAFLYLTAPKPARRGALAVALGSFAAGNLFLLGLVIQLVRSGGAISLDITRSDTFLGLIVGPRWFAFWHLPETLKYFVLRLPQYLLYQFPLWGTLLGMAGFWVSWRRSLAERTLMAGVFLLGGFFAFGYIPTRQWVMLLPSFFVFSLWIGLGLDALVPSVRRWAGTRSPTGGVWLRQARAIAGAGIVVLLAATPIVLYAVIVPVTKALKVDPIGGRAVPYRDNIAYFLVPSKAQYQGAAKFGHEALSRAAPNAMIIADFTPFAVLQYMQVIEGQRRDVRLVPVDAPAEVRGLNLALVRENIDRVPIYLASVRDYQDLYRLDELRREFVVAPEGLLYRVARKREGPSRESGR